ncbi:F-box protein SKIP14-like protein [Carex littledalei]|uniref:F-box protein SKIP14-like protein n=1 Tax=Carex littledalei TaxID=544730 RepID=A0A833RDV4_9POAL|nr:F-box protein SKIP14-like protein [Carex littledalei]
MALDDFSFHPLFGSRSDRDLDYRFLYPSFGFAADWDCVDMDCETADIDCRFNNAAQFSKISATDWEFVDMDCETADFLPDDPFEMNPSNPVNLLPSDPFEMDIQTSLNNAISDLICSLPNLVTTSSSPMVSDESAASNASSEMEVPSSSAPVSAASQIPEGMVYALGYLGVKDLLSVEQVCKSLHEAVRGDPLLWMSIQIDSPLSERINDETLLKVTRKAQGNLRALSMVSCLYVTDEGLRCVLEENPLLTKLYVPDCARLTLDGLITNLKFFNSRNYPGGIKHLKLGRLFNISERHYNELTALFSANSCHPSPQPKPRFYHIARFSMMCNEDRALDIEACPVCKKYRLVYDCPLESCKGRRDPCRACESCILRCVLCGKCIRDSTYTETFSFEYLCSSC